MNYISQNLKALRSRFGLSQGKFAEEIGQERHNIAAWEGGRAQPGIDDLIKIGNYFNIPLNDLLSEELDDNFFNRVEDDTRPYQATDLKSCMSLLRYLESELKSKNEIIKSLIDLLRNKE